MLELVPIVEMVDFLDPLRQSIQCLLRLGIDRSGMLGRQPPQGSEVRQKLRADHLPIQSPAPVGNT